MSCSPQGLQPRAEWQRTVDLGARVENLTRVMGEPCKVNPVFLARNRLCRLALFDVEHLNRLVVACAYQVISLVVKVQRRYVVGAILLGCFEDLELTISILGETV